MMQPTDDRGALVDCAWLDAHRSEARVVVLDVGAKPDDFAAGHVPGARYVDAMTELMGTDQRIRFADIADVLGRCGVTAESFVVCCGEHPALGTFLFWILATIGHADARVLDGGRRAWLAAGTPVEAGPGQRSPTAIYRCGAGDPTQRADAEQVRAALGSGTQLVDVRTEQEFRGEWFTTAAPAADQRAGHIPGAIHLPFEFSLRPDGTFRSDGEVRAALAAAGIRDDRSVITYCAVGARSAHAWFAMTRVAGLAHVRNYDGSWLEWSRLPGAPVEP